MLMFSFPSSQLYLFVERPGVGEESLTVDHEHRQRGARHRLRQVHTGRQHPVQSNDKYCLQLCPPGAD